MEEAFILACVRSPMTKAGKGGLASLRIDDVGAHVIRGLLQKIPQFDSSFLEDVIVGCAMPEGEQGLNVARNIALLASLPVSAGAVTINRYCASSLEAINQAAQAVMCGNGELFIAGGIESMSHVPMGGFNPSLNELLMREGKVDAYISMGLTAENVASTFSITREEQDHFALMSHMKAVTARERGHFQAEIIPIEVVGSDGSAKMLSNDECPRPDTSLEILAKLEPAFLKGGTVTAGNSSPLTDGAAFAVLASRRAVKRMGIKPIACVRAMAIAGVAPEMMGIGPVEAVPKALARAKMKLKNIDLIELNEAFAAQSIAVMRKLDFDEKKVNIHGGAIALGHPLGMSGTRIVTTLIHALREKKLSVGLATMCIGGGQGAATVLEMV